MFANRSVYILSLTAAISFYFASGVWFSWALVFVLLILPPVSLLCSLPQMLRLRLSLSAQETVEQGQTLLLQLKLQSISWLPLPNVQLRVRTRYQNEQTLSQLQLTQLPRQGGTVHQQALLPGFVQAEVCRVRVCDYLGLFRLPRRAPRPVISAVLPRPVQPRPQPDFSLFRAARLVPLPAGSFSEQHDHRPYRPGDNARSIHWKLSQKAEEIIVREPVQPVRLRTAVVFSPPATLPALQSELAQLRCLSERLLEEEIAHTVVWAAQAGPELREVTDETSARAVLAEVCKSPVFREKLPELASPEADWCYRVLPAGEGAV